MNDDYRPLACSQHETYEHAVLKQSMLDINWYDEGGDRHRARVVPIDVVTCDRAEYLVVKQKDKVIRSIRLERILEAKKVAGGEGRRDR